MRIRLRLLTIFTVLLACLSAACNRTFYLSESEAAAYSAALRTKQDADSLFAPLVPPPSSTSPPLWNIQFDSNGHIRSSNLTALLRATRLGLTEQIFRQIQLERLSSQIHSNIDTWISQHLALLRGSGENLIRLDSLQSATVYFRVAPVFTYRSDVQQIRFDFTIRFSVSGTLDVHDPGGIFGFFVGPFFPNGRFPLTVTLENYRLRGIIQLPRFPGDARELRFTLSPQPGTVTVGGTAPASVRNGIRQLFRTLLAGQVRETYSLRFDFFEVPNIRLTSETTPRLETSYRPLPPRPEPILNVVARSQDGKLHHARRISGRWSAFSEIPLRRTVVTDPVLISSGPDQLELAAVASNGDLVFTSWRESSWGNRFVSVPDTEYDVYANKKPALVATALGQLELFAIRGYDGTFVHLRRLNGQWLPLAEVSDTARLAQPPFRDPVAVQTGNKIVLVYADRTDQLFATVFDLESGVWSQSQQISHSPGWTHHAPAAVSCGDGRIDVVYVGRSQAPYHVSLTVAPGPVNANTGGYSYTPFVAIGGALTDSPALACSGFRRLELIGRGTDGRLYHNHFVSEFADPVGTVDGRTFSEGWQGWTDASERLFGSAPLQFRNIISPAIVSSNTGELHLVGRQTPSTSPQNLFHNSYDSSRYGRAPWRTIHWRGFEQVSTSRFVGTPALTLTTRQTQLALVAANSGILTAKLLENSPPAFAALSNSSLRTPFDPVILSSGPGIVDFLFTGSDGKPHHLRQLNGNTVRSFNPPGDITSPVTAVSFGNGQIELVARGGDAALYHWRFRNGTWSSWNRLGGATTSVPVIVSTGAGQFELFALGTDFHLNRWRFSGGRWSSSESIPSDFLINSPLFGPQAFSSWGDGTVDFVVVEQNTGKMFHHRLNSPNFSQTFNLIGGNVTDTPALTALGPFRLNILVPGTDNRLYSTWSSHSQYLIPVQPASSTTPRPVRPAYTRGPETLLWTGFELVGPPRVFVGNIVRLNDREMIVLAFDPQGRVYTNRFVAGRWSAFLPVFGMDSTQRHVPPFRPVLTPN